MSAVLRVAWRESAKSDRREQQALSNFLHYFSGSVPRQDNVTQAYCKDLVGADGRIAQATRLRLSAVSFLGSTLRCVGYGLRLRISSESRSTE